MAVASAISIPITAFDRTAGAFGSVTKGLGKVGLNVAKLGAAFATLGVAAGAAIVRSQMNTIDALGKTADKIGTTTEALGAMRHAAAITGVATTTLDMSLQRFVRRTSEASVGMGEARGAFRELGIDVQSFNQLPLEAQIGTIADKMETLRSQTDRVRIAQKLFDSEGVAMVQMLAEGSAGLKEMSEEAGALGLLLDRADVAQIEAANDSFTRASAVIEGLINQFTIGLAPFAEEVANMMRQAALDSEDFGAIGMKAARAVVEGVATLLDIMQSFRIGLKMAEIGWESFKFAGLFVTNVLVSGVSVLIDGLNVVRELLGKDLIGNPVNDALFESANNLEFLRAELTALQDAPGALDTISPMFDEIERSSRRAAEGVAKVKSSLLDQGETIKKQTQTQIEGDKKLSEFKLKDRSDQAQQVTSSLRDLFNKNKAFNVAGAIMDTYKGATLALASYPQPLGGIMAAATVASGLAQVAQIKSQSFEGGGFTGRGARVGGADGKGGFMAMLHPNESVIDHTKGQAGGITVVNNVDARGSGADVEQKIKSAMAQTSQQTIMTIQDLMRRRRLV
jgi:hypothetical protein